MPSLKQQVKRETRVPEVRQRAAGRKLNRLPVAGQSTKRMLPKSASSASVSPEGGNCLSKERAGPGNGALYVPVVGSTGTPLMPCHPARARELVCKGRAVRRWSKSLFYIRLLNRANGEVQSVVVGIDPGSKKEGFTVKSESRTYLNVQTDAVTWVKKAVEIRRNARRARRFRKTPCRANRMNWARGGLPPSTKARWQWKLRILAWLGKVFPIETVVVEDIKARTTGRRRWDQSFSPLQIGKQWFYDEIGKVYRLETRQGWETKELRDAAGLKKSSSKLSNRFDAHCIDSWVLANWWVGGHIKPDNQRMLLIAPVQLHRRMLHRQNPQAGGKRPAYGGTRSLGFKRGSLVKHPKYGLAYVGGTSKAQISLHDKVSGRRLCQTARPEDCTFLAFNHWKGGDSAAV